MKLFIVIIGSINGGYAAWWTEDDLRNRYFDFPFGKADSYQIILFLSGHTKRHTDQIKEVIANEKFPQS